MKKKGWLLSANVFLCYFLSITWIVRMFFEAQQKCINLVHVVLTICWTGLAISWTITLPKLKKSSND